MPFTRINSEIHHHKDVKSPSSIKTRSLHSITVLQAIVLILSSCGSGAGVFSADASSNPGMPTGDKVLQDYVVAEDTPELESLTNQILLKEIALERFFMKYRTISIDDPKWRHSRYFWSQLAAASGFLGTNIMTLVETGKHLRSPQSVSNNVLKGASDLGLVSSAVEGASSGFELGSNTLMAMKHKRTHNDPETARKIFTERLKEIDALIAARSKLVETTRGKEGFAIFETEGQVLKYSRDCCVYEFADIYSDAKSYQASQNVYYSLDVASSSLYVASFILSLKSFKVSSLGQPSATTGIVGDSIAVGSAPASTIAYNKIYYFYWGRLSRQLNEHFYDARTKLKEAMVKMETAMKERDPQLVASLGAVATRYDIYTKWSDRDAKFIAKQEIELRRQDKISLQSNISGPLIAGGFLSQDVIGSVIASKDQHNIRAANSNSFAGSIPVTVASTASVGITALGFIGDQLHTRQLRRAGELPDQMIQFRLNTLDDLETTLNKATRH